MFQFLVGRKQLLFFQEKCFVGEGLSARIATVNVLLNTSRWVSSWDVHLVRLKHWSGDDFMGAKLLGAVTIWEKSVVASIVHVYCISKYYLVKITADIRYSDIHIYIYVSVYIYILYLSLCIFLYLNLCHGNNTWSCSPFETWIMSAFRNTDISSHHGKGRWRSGRQGGKVGCPHNSQFDLVCSWLILGKKLQRSIQ